MAGEAAAAIYANEEAIRYFERALALSVEVGQRPVQLIKLGDVRHLIGEWTGAEAAYREALALAKEQADLSMQALGQSRLGHLLIYRGAYAEALAVLDQARVAAEGRQDRQMLGQIVGEMGIAYWYQGDYANALAHLEQRLQLAQESGDRQGASTAIANMGIVYWSQGDYRRALDCYEQKLQADTEVGDRLSMSKALGNIGIVYRDLGNYAVAMSRLRQKLQIDEELGDQLGVSIALENIGNVYELQGDYDQGLRCNERCLQIALQLGHWPGVSVALGRLAKIYLAQGQQEPLIEQLAGQAIALGRTLNIPRNLCDYLYTQAHFYFHRQRYAEAQALNDEALALARRVKQEKVHFLAAILAIRLRAAADPQQAPAAVAELRRLLAVWESESQQARLYYEMWRLQPSLHDAHKQAAARYAGLYAVTPNVDYRRHYQELTGQTLAPPPPLPPLPDTVARLAIDLPALLAQVDHRISELSSRDG
jgi:tetratricopeptide (TPR) repeat protein